MENNNYLNEFLSLRCAPDVLGAVGPLGKHPAKEITEAMAIMRPLRKIVMAEKMKYSVMELCAGNALPSVLSAHLLPIKKAYAVDIRPRKRKWEQVDRFEYIVHDIKYLWAMAPKWIHDGPWIIIASHACKDLAGTIIDIHRIYHQSMKHLIMLPCCKGEIPSNTFTAFENKTLSPYQKWCLFLAREAQGDLYFDQNCLSPCNGVIVASK